MFFEKSGLKALESEWDNGAFVRMTQWDDEGRVAKQKRPINNRVPLRLGARGAVQLKGNLEVWSDPPWEWGVQDQTHPTAPWWSESERAEATPVREPKR